MSLIPSSLGSWRAEKEDGFAPCVGVLQTDVNLFSWSLLSPKLSWRARGSSGMLLESESAP